MRRSRRSRAGFRSLTGLADRTYTPPSRPRGTQAFQHVCAAVATRPPSLFPRTHVRSHRDRREAVPRRGRHRARGRAARRRARPVDHAGARAPRGRRGRSHGRHPRRGRRGRRGRGPGRHPWRQGHRLQVPPEGAPPRQEGPPPGADGPPDQRHPVRGQERGRERTQADEGREPQGARGRRREAGRRRRRARREAERLR